LRRIVSPPEAAVVFLQDLALSALLGANLFGRIAMNPALESVSGKAERGKVLNDAWRRYGTVNSVALLALAGGWIRERRLGATRRGPCLAKDLAVGSVVLTGLAAAAGGVGFAQQAPEGAVPMTSGHDTAPETPGQAVRLKRLVNALGALNMTAEIGLLAVNAVRAGRRA
jgi:hypothetical protein